MTTKADHYDVAIAGAGPAGSSAAIHLAMRGLSVLLVEQKKFPRAKLCGEFISPECLRHFEELGVSDRMLSGGGARLTKTVFYSRSGRSLEIASEWFRHNSSALGLSRSEMDQNLLTRAKEVGVTVIEGAQASGLIIDRGFVRGLRLKINGEAQDRYAQLSIDATGRGRTLTRKLDRSPRVQVTKTRRPKLIAFKAHLKNTRVAAGTCEIYSYPGGYGGLNDIEGGLSNFCFIAAAKDVRRFDSNPEIVVRESVFKNRRAARTLAYAEACTEWLSVSLERFGRQPLVPAAGLITIGDAAAFIDPFTGSGMLMALESGKLVAQTIREHIKKVTDEGSFAALAHDYEFSYHRRFNSRLQICGWLRHAGFFPFLGEAAIMCFRSSAWLLHKVARATRPSPASEPHPSVNG